MKRKTMMSHSRNDAPWISSFFCREILFSFLPNKVLCKWRRKAIICPVNLFLKFWKIFCCASIGQLYLIWLQQSGSIYSKFFDSIIRPCDLFLVSCVLDEKKNGQNQKFTARLTYVFHLNLLNFSEYARLFEWETILTCIPSQ